VQAALALWAALLQAYRARRDSVMKNHLVRSLRRVGRRISHSCARSATTPKTLSASL